MSHTTGYQKLLQQMRAQYPNWGNARRHAIPVAREILAHGLTRPTILDYGCGLGRLAEELREYRVTNYDPSIPAWSVLPPGPFDVVVCTHVLEHVEPNLLRATLREIGERAGSLIYIEVPHTEGGKVLPDGRNVHLTIEPWAYWFRLLCEELPDFDIETRTAPHPDHSIFVLTRWPETLAA